MFWQQSAVMENIDDWTSLLLKIVQLVLCKDQAYQQIEKGVFKVRSWIAIKKHFLTYFNSGKKAVKLKS
jgi:hypothetical protein